MQSTNFEQKLMTGVQNINVGQQPLSDQNHNSNKTSAPSFSSGPLLKQSNSDGKHHHDQQRLTHEQVIIKLVHVILL